MAYYTAGVVGSYFRGAATPNGFDISGSTVSAGNFLMAGGGRFRDTSGLLDISGGNLTVAGVINAGAIATPGIAPTNIVVPGYIRDNILSPNMDISGANIRIAGRMTNGPGSVSAPSYTFVNDLSMGLYDPATNVLGVVTSGVERMRVAATGQVGIGTTDPAYPLDISATSNALRATVTSSAPGEATSVMLHPNLDNSRQTWRVFGVLDYGANAVRELFNYVGLDNASNSWNIRFAGQSTGEGLTLLANGNLGLRTSAPAYLLDVSGTAQLCNALVPGYIRNNLGASQFDISGGNIRNVGQIQTGSGYTLSVDASDTITAFSNIRTHAGSFVGVSESQYLVNGAEWPLLRSYTFSNGIWTYKTGSTTGGLIFKTQISGTNAERMRIGSNGFLGIGTSAPAYLLDVSGGDIGNTGRILTGVGTAAAPAHSFTADASMGLYDAGTNILGFATSGTQRLTIDACGNINNNNLFYFWSNSNLPVNTAGSLHFGGTSGSPVSGRILFGDGTGWQMRFASRSGTTTDIVTIDDRARLGIGCNAPQNTLDISTATTFDGIRMTGPSPVINMYVRGTEANGNTFQIFANSTNGGITQFDNARGLTFNTGTNNTPRLAIGSNGNVAIGSGHTNPELALDVSASAQYTAAFRGSGGTQAGIWVVNGAGAGTTTGIQMYQNANGQGLFTASGNAQPMHFWTNGAIRASITSAGNVGIGTTAPTTTLDISSSADPGIILRNRAGQASMMFVGSGVADTSGLQIFQSGTAQGLYQSNTMALSLWTRGAQRFTIDQSGNTGIGTTTLSNYRMSIRGTGTATGTIAFHKSSDDKPYVGIGYDQTVDASDGLAFFTNDGAANFNGTAMFIGRANRRVGVGTTAPGYRLDVVSTATTDAAINMSTWPRYAISFTHNVRGTVTNVAKGAGLVAGLCLLFNTPAVALNANLGVVVNDASYGTYFQCKRNGIWEIGYQLHGANELTSMAIDVSNNITDNVDPNTGAVQFRSLAFNTAGYYTGNVRYCGYLPSNDNLYYKFKGNAFQQDVNTSNARLQITFLGEQPQAAGNWPLP